MDKLDTSKGIMNQKRDSTLFKKKRLLKALKKTLGVIQPACRMVRVSRQTFYNWLKTDLQFKEDYQEIREESLDFAEASLMQQIAERNPRATIFFLSHKGKDRGWGLPNSRKANYNSNQKYSDDLENMSDEQLMVIINKEYHIKMT